MPAISILFAISRLPREWGEGGGGVGGALGFYSISVDVSPLYSRLFTLPMLAESAECSLHFGMENSGSYCFLSCV